MVRRIFLTLVMVAMHFPTQAFSEPRLRGGEAEIIAIEEPGQTRLFAIDANEGDYIKGTFNVTRGRIRVELVDAVGNPLRRLVERAEGESEFQFVVGSQDERLQITAETATEARVLIVNRVEVGEQKVPKSQPVSPRMLKLMAAVEQGDTTEAFWNEISATGTPLVEQAADGQTLVTFLGRGAMKNIRMFGAPSGDHENLERLAETDVWFKTFSVPADTRLSYQLAFDVPDLPGSDRDRRVAILATAAADPLNRKLWPAEAPDRFNQDSILELPGAPEQPFVVDRGHQRGAMSNFRLAAKKLGNERDITIYTPPAYDPGNADNLLLFVFDAREYLSKVPLPLILDNMIAEKRIPPVVAVFVANPDRRARGRELAGNAAFADFMAKELLPEVVRRTDIIQTPGRTILAGSSYGGLAAATVALRHPEAFGNVLSLSGSFWWSPPGTDADKAEHVAWEVATGPQREIRFFLTAGLFETKGSHTVGGILETNRHLRDVLTAKNYNVTLKEYAGGHDYLVWRGAFSDGLEILFGH
ncbi:alpha/beta hydrolase-fold protein [Ensifer sp.]|jgi:enterochelin esterase family protein|uniref:alpha/beta hydrolase-fold protein n=1 Tax=Ensifer sp. TaxID=1872086 RepID=UPI002E1427EB|nr:alpha/beta hydrolase-fold protein [Ensifer sp.]